MDIIIVNKKMYKVLAEQYDQKVGQRRDHNAAIISHFCQYIKTSSICHY